MTSFDNYTIKQCEKTNTAVIPIWIWEDLVLHSNSATPDIISEDAHNVLIKLSDLDSVRQSRKIIYYQCSWYHKLTDLNIPVIESKISRCDDFEIMQTDINNHWEELDDYLRIFVKFCNASPKDIINPPLFDKFDCMTGDVVNIFQKSNRTNFMMTNVHKPHLIIKPAVKITYELRCFWHKHKLRAVSGPHIYISPPEQDHIIDIVINFFEKYKIPYNSVTIDIAINTDNIFIIELNSFGCDAWAGAGLFRWTEDANILYNSNKVIFRFKDEWDW